MQQISVSPLIATELVQTIVRLRLIRRGARSSEAPFQPVRPAAVYFSIRLQIKARSAAHELVSDEAF
jgi:hypothetical protein